MDSVVDAGEATGAGTAVAEDEVRAGRLVLGSKVEQHVVPTDIDISTASFYGTAAYLPRLLSEWDTVMMERAQV